jgi:hypothetical protein
LQFTIAKAAKKSKLGDYSTIEMVRLHCHRIPPHRASGVP